MYFLFRSILSLSSAILSFLLHIALCAHVHSELIARGCAMCINIAEKERAHDTTTKKSPETFQLCNRYGVCVNKATQLVHRAAHSLNWKWALAMQRFNQFNARLEILKFRCLCVVRRLKIRCFLLL